MVDSRGETCCDHIRRHSSGKAPLPLWRPPTKERPVRSLVQVNWIERYSDRATWRFAVAEFGNHLVGVVEDISLLLNRHIDGILVAISVKTNFVASVSNLLTLLWKSPLPD